MLFDYCRSSDSICDSVLKKDVAVSCSILEKNSNINILTSTIDKYLLKQIKSEYGEFKKYLQNLTKNYKRKSLNVNIIYLRYFYNFSWNYCISSKSQS